MIYFFCGAAKNASHYQRYIIEEALKQKGLPYSVRGNDIFHRHDHVGARKLFSELDARREETFLCKGHWGSRKESQILLSFPSVRVFLIWRHLLDAIISAYHFENNLLGANNADFDEFYDQQGRIYYIEQLLYRRTWMSSIGRANVYEVNFEALKHDFAREAKSMLDFAGIQSVNLAALQEELKIERLRQTRNDGDGKFFRKGMPGEHKSFRFAPRILADMHRLKRMDSLRLKAERQVGRAAYHLRRRIFRTA